MKRVKIFDTTLRDGEQSPGATLNHQEKILIAKQLAKLNVDVIEAGFPIASNDDYKAVREIAKTIKGTKIAALARCRKKDIDRAWSAVKHAKKPRLHVFLATSPIHMRYKLKMTPGQIIRTGTKAVRYAKKFCNDIEFSPEDASRTKPEFLYEVLEKVIEAGATTVNIPDTVGYAQPKEFGELIKGINKNVKGIENVTVSVHCHNDLGLAVANSLEAVRNGALQVECTMNGIGERAGNASLEEIVMSLYTRKDCFNATTGIKLKEIYKTSRMVRNFTGIPIQPNKAIVGKNAFAHEAGIHQHGILSKRQCYEIMNPKTIGVETELVIGKHSGKHAIASQLKRWGYELDKRQLKKVMEKIKELADKEKKVMKADIIAIANDVTNELSTAEQRIKLKELLIMTGNKITPTAKVKLKVDGVERFGVGEGVGPVDALNNALRPLIDPNISLKEYNLKAITGGTDALADVSIKLEDKKKNIFSAEAINEDVIMASAEALIKGANKVLNFEKREKKR